MKLFKKCVFVIHGFGGALWENEYLVNEFTRKGFDVYAYTLPGHEKDVLGGVKYEEWIKSSEDKLKELLNEYLNVYVIGCSMGGVIATYLTSKYKRIRKLILLAPAFEYANFEKYGKDLKFWDKEKVKVPKESVYKEILSKMFRVSLFSIFEFTKLVKKYSEYAYELTNKTLILIGDIDEIVPIKCYEYLKNAMPIPDILSFTLVKDGAHRLLAGNRKEDVTNYIYNYIIGGLRWKKMKKSVL